MTQRTLFDQQAENLTRVGGKIGAHVLAFVKAKGIGGLFHAKHMHDYVEKKMGGYSAPASADRILRDLRSKGALNYRIINRRQSLYEVIKP